jgi:hypothetical protein
VSEASEPSMPADRRRQSRQSRPARPTGHVDPSHPAARPPWRLWDHIGVISGLVLGLATFGFLVLLAALGDPDALTLIVFIVAGIALVYFGGRMHGLQRR